MLYRTLSNFLPVGIEKLVGTNSYLLRYSALSCTYRNINTSVEEEYTVSKRKDKIESTSQWLNSNSNTTNNHTSRNLESSHACEQQVCDNGCLHTSDANDAKVSTEEEFIPGDSFGINNARTPFYYPIPRLTLPGRLGELMPENASPERCVNITTLNYLCAKYNLSIDDALSFVLSANGDINKAIKCILESKQYENSIGNFGLVCLESYAPETFCLVSFCLPNYSATRDDNVLDAIHEVTLSAAEMPLDTPQHLLKTKMMIEWTIEDGTRCKDVLEEHNMTIKEIVMLPHGEYSVHGFYVLHPVKADTPNIGVAAAACCLDLRTGVHKQFRFQFERVADSISEHIVQEAIHYDQGVHLLRQPYWFNSEYSVEEVIRYQEIIFNPSAQMHELRYAMLSASPYNLPYKRNLVELEKLRKIQQRYSKAIEIDDETDREYTNDYNANNLSFLADPLSTPGATLSMESNVKSAGSRKYDTVKKIFEQTHKYNIEHYERIFATFYRNNYY